MAKSYHKICDYCKKEIIMSDEGGKWQPFNLNNGKHDCRDRDREKKQEFTLEQVLKKLESVGVKINLMELMKE